MGLLEAGALLLIVKKAYYSGVRWITNILFPCPTDPLMLDLVGSPAFGGVTCRDSNGDSSNPRETECFLAPLSSIMRRTCSTPSARAPE